MSKPIPPRPADFHEKVYEMSLAALRRNYACGFRTIDIWCEQLGIDHTVIFAKAGEREMPADFPQNADLPMVELTVMYRCGTQPITRWRRQIGWIEPVRKRFAPDDFLDHAKDMTLKQCSEYFKAAHATVKRWYQDHGIDPAVHRSEFKSISTIDRMGRVMPSASLSDRAHSIHDDAMRTLRTAGWVSYRSNEQGRQSERGQFFRVGNVVCDGDELLARAAKYARAAA